MQAHAFRQNGTAEGHGGGGGEGKGRGGRVRMGCYQNVSEQTSTKGQQQYSKCQYLAMRRATGAAGAAQQTLRRAEEQHHGELLVTRSARTYVC